MWTVARGCHAVALGGASLQAHSRVPSLLAGADSDVTRAPPFAQKCAVTAALLQTCRHRGSGSEALAPALNWVFS